MSARRHHARHRSNPHHKATHRAGKHRSAHAPHPRVGKHRSANDVSAVRKMASHEKGLRTSGRGKYRR